MDKCDPPDRKNGKWISGRLPLIISFKKQEVRPETAMEITQKFVEKYFGGDFQCLNAAHDNTGYVHSKSAGKSASQLLMFGTVFFFLIAVVVLVGNRWMLRLLLARWRIL